MRKLMKRVSDEGTGRQAQLSGNRYAGGKTGTSSDYYDLWFVGLDDHYTTGLWLGKDQPGSIRYASESSYHTQLWKQIMEY